MLDRTRFDLRAIGLGSLAMPLLACACFVGLSLLTALDASQSGGGGAQAHHNGATGLLFLLEFGLPPVAGLVAANLIAADPAKELHLSLKRPYAQTMRRRMALFTVWSALVSTAALIGVQATGYWIAPQSAPLSQLTWAAPLLWFVGLGSVLTLLLRSRVGSSAVLGMLWLGELLFRSYLLHNDVLQKLYLFLTASSLAGGDAPNASYWLANRLTLIALGLAFLAITSLLLTRNESVLSSEE
ncbi:MAG TPA: hypothetical protein VGI27_01295 [Solirubrobacteraceae bacterium]